MAVHEYTVTHAKKKKISTSKIFLKTITLFVSFYTVTSSFLYSKGWLLYSYQAFLAGTYTELKIIGLKILQSQPIPTNRFIIVVARFRFVDQFFRQWQGNGEWMVTVLESNLNLEARKEREY